MSLRPARPTAPLRLDATSRSFSDQSNESYDSTSTSKPPKSPGSRLTTLFGWKTSSDVAESSTTTFSDKSHSPMPSPLSPSPQSSSTSHKSLPLIADISKAVSTPKASYSVQSALPLPKSMPAMATQVGEMEEELREVSSELAASIKREMDLEDLVDRLQLEASQGLDTNRRTSDYFSDSGTSSVRYPLSEMGGKSEDLEKWKRTLEQDKAQFKVDFSQKLQIERARRKVLETHIQRLEEQAQNVGTSWNCTKIGPLTDSRQSDPGRVESIGAMSRVRELESSLEDLRRKLLEERQLKQNFEDLLTALRAEIEEHQNERDNLRDEVVPRLRARVDGLEADSAESQKLTYEYSRMQQEIQSLRNENSTLVNARRLHLEMQQQQARINSIAEEDEPSADVKVGLTRSTSLARASGMNAGPTRSASLSGSKSIIAKERESRDSLADRVKDIEIQRDALHKALKSLLERQEYQNRETQKRMRALETERDKAIQSGSPRRLGYEREVSCLREEINQLRRRADDALEQKWQCEKGLGGLKMDLDRAEQETGSLRKLLHEHEILVPEAANRLTQDSEIDNQSGSASLEKAYKELQTTHALSLARIRELRGSAPMLADDAETANTLELLKKSISEAEVERDLAEQQAGQYRAQAESLREAESFHASENNSLAGQLRASADRVEALAEQVRQQLEANSALRQRLAEAIARGEKEQRASATRINDMQGRLRSLEDKVMAAQQHSEEAVATHEEEVKELRESHNVQLQRIKSGLRTPVSFSPKSPLSPLFSAKSPKLGKTTSGMAMSLNKALRTEFLEKRVEELEKALTDADSEMEEVVGRMNMAQIEVMELQSARYVAHYEQSNRTGY